MSGRRPVVQMIWTREIDGQPMAGRLRVAMAVRDAARGGATVRETVIAPGRGSMLSRLPGIVGAWAASVVRGPLLPFQCALYAAPGDVRRAVAAVGDDVDTVYLDGVRTFAVLRALRRRFPDKRLVVDLDDLMSRRLRLLKDAGQPLAPGHLASRLPSWLVGGLMGKLGRLVVSYEVATLPRVEAAIVALADAVVLLSARDMAELRGEGRAERIDILPPVSPVGAHPVLKPGPIRFIFIGADALTQNRLTIDRLLRLWRDERPRAELVIYGRQSRGVPLPPGVRLAGYVPNIDDAYDGHSVLLSPSYLRGGVKTKVLEAFAHGTAVIGNEVTFEAMHLADYPLTCDEDRIVALVRDPEAHRATIEAAAAAGARYVREWHATDRIAERWRDVLHIGAAYRGGGAR